MTISIYTDASVHLQTSEAGFAYQIDSYQMSYQYANHLSKDTTGQAELHCITHAVRSLIEKELIPVTQVQIFTDSTEAMSKIRNAKHEAFFTMIDFTIKNGMHPRQVFDLFKISHIKAHTKGTDKASNANRWCDFMAKTSRHSKSEFKATIFDNSDILL